MNAFMTTPVLVIVPAALLAAAALAPAQDGDQTGFWNSLRRRFDADGDGRVSADEYRRRPLLFERLDRDRDGFLTDADFRSVSSTPMETAAPATGDGASAREPSAEDVLFFESRIRPVLANACFSCHADSAPKLRGGLKVDSREALLRGGASGPAIVPGDPDASLLVRAVRYDDEDLQMPPKRALGPDVANDFARWVEMGAPWPGASAAMTASKDHAAYGIDLEKGRQWWAFQPPVKAEPPATKNTDWPQSDIDRFLLAAMEEKGVAPVGDAERAAWLRRVTFDLTGLPPTPEELATFEKDRSPGAFDLVIDRLLASPRFGERWGRHWLDVARYAESSGKDSNVLYPHAWRYRDWVIGAFNQDEPFDQFLERQIAGDLLPAMTDDQRAANIIATGYLALGTKGHNTRDVRQFALDVADEQIDAFSQGMLGLTIACARCHDHKFDPIPTRDYYAIAGIFLSTETCFGTKRGPGNNRPSDLIPLPEGAYLPNGPEMGTVQRAALERLRERAAKQAEEAAALLPRDNRTRPGTGAADEAGGQARPDPQVLQRARIARETTALLDDLLSRFDEEGRALPANRLSMGVRESRARDARVLERGEMDKAGATVPRGVLQVLSDAATPRITRGSGRRELADWITSEKNPLTARVWVNRVWLHLFGSGIVPTPDNFGASSMAPRNQALLDWLAVTFMEDGWSTKRLIRRIVRSHAYRLASEDHPAHRRVDPDATLLWRMPERRLDAEAIRDAMLAAAGTLVLEPPVGSPVGVLEGNARNDQVLDRALADRPVRSVYLPIVRDRLPEALEVFDAADPAFVTGDRDETSGATQALFLMNDAGVLQAADALAARLLALPGNDDARIEQAFLLVLGREPTGAEATAVRQFLREFPKTVAKGGAQRGDARPGRRDRGGDAPPADPRVAAWSAFVQTLFQTAEFRLLD